MSLHNCYLSTTPTIALRTPEDVCVLRIVNGHTPTADIVMLVKTDGVYSIKYAHCQSGQYSKAAILGYLVSALKTEAGIDFELVAWSDKPHLVTADWGVHLLYIGKKQMAVFQTGADGSVSPEALDISAQHESLRETLHRLAVDVLHRESYHSDSTREKAISEISRLYQSLDEAALSCFRDLYSVPVDLTVLDQVKAVAIYRLLLGFVARTNVARVTITDYNGGSRVFATEKMGVELAAMELVPMSVSSHPVIFIELDKPVSTLTVFFLVGFLRKAVERSGTTKAFYNRYKFINFDQHTQLVDAAVKAIIENKEKK